MIGNMLKLLYKNNNNVIFCVDTNLTNNEKIEFDNNFGNFVDCWMQNGKQISKQYTYDNLTNEHLIDASKLKSRLDRIMYKCDKTIRLHNFLLTNNNLYRNIQPSNHYGCVADFYIYH